MKAAFPFVLLLLLLAAPAAADVDIHGVLTTGGHVIQIDSVQFQVGMIATFITPGWGGNPSETDTFDFPPAPVWPTFALVFGAADGNPVQASYAPFMPDSWYIYGPTIPDPAQLLFWQTEGIEEPGGLPAGLASATASPSVFSGRVTLSCVAPAPGPVRLTIADAAGRAVLTRAVRAGAGAASFTWDARDASGRELPGGVYICRFESPGLVAATRALLAR